MKREDIKKIVAKEMKQLTEVITNYLIDTQNWGKERGLPKLTKERINEALESFENYLEEKVADDFGDCLRGYVD